ncbi:hypothetical protein [Nocardia sp. NPDC057227]|uniref:hypothetical protein n=1 Tax=Nocardia sp. NPDC057227 TaxID=3346056 RepID=UPI003628DCD7
MTDLVLAQPLTLGRPEGCELDGDPIALPLHLRGPLGDQRRVGPLAGGLRAERMLGLCPFEHDAGVLDG